MTLDPGQVKFALDGFDGLGGWQVEDGALVRGVPVSHDSRQALIEAVAAVAAESPITPEVHLQPGFVVLRLADPAGWGVTPHDVELAARIDQVLSGSASDQGAG